MCACSEIMLILIFSGNVSTANNGGFTSVRTRVSVYLDFMISYIFLSLKVFLLIILEESLST